METTKVQAAEDLKQECLIIGIGFKVSQLRGIGTEYLVKDNNVLAKFFNGHLVGEISRGSSEEPTKK